jgi:parallel beta-helix repeat protein
VADDYIGINSNGVAAANSGNGIYVAATSSNNDIGYNPSAASNVVSNVISGNSGDGIDVNGSSHNTLVDNYVGTDPTGTKAIANGGSGIVLTGHAGDNELGGTVFTDSNTGEQNNPTGSKGTTDPVFVVPPLGNLVSGNSQNGVLIDDGSRNNVLNGNFIGTTSNGDTKLGNGQDGVDIDGANNNSLIGCQVTNEPFVYYNVASGNGANGLEVTDSDNTTIYANFFGISADNSKAIGNALNGILVDGSSRNTTVGNIIPLGNVEAGNGENGIDVAGTASRFTTFNSFGGLFAFGGAAPNGNDGLLITATGGNQTVRTNVFSGNSNNGIEIGGNASGITVDPVIAGLDTKGTSLLPNGGDGLLIDGTAHGNIVGGYLPSVIPQNTFSGNVGYGVAIVGHAYLNQVFNTYIGTSIGGTDADGNLAGGVLVGGSAFANIIGGIANGSAKPVADLISANQGNGITLGADTTFSFVLNNLIGFDRRGHPVLPNTGIPIATDGSKFNVILGNQIAGPPESGANQNGATINPAVGLVSPEMSFFLRPIQTAPGEAPHHRLTLRRMPRHWGRPGVCRPAWMTWCHSAASLVSTRAPMRWLPSAVSARIMASLGRSSREPVRSRTL